MVRAPLRFNKYQVQSAHGETSSSRGDACPLTQAWCVLRDVTLGLLELTRTHTVILIIQFNFNSIQYNEVYFNILNIYSSIIDILITHILIITISAKLNYSR